MSSQLDADITKLLQLLQQMLTPNTQSVQGAVIGLNEMFRRPESMAALLQVMSQAQHEYIRQLAAVLMRKRITGHWGKFSAEFQNHVKTVLLQRLASDPSRPVRHAIASVIAILARITVPVNQWNELLQFLHECTQAPSVDHRELGMNLFATLSETIGDHMRTHVNVMFNIFLKGLQDTESKVRAATLKAIQSLVEWLTTDSEIALFAKLLEPMASVIKHCIDNGLSEEAMSAFEVFDDIVETPLPVVDPYIPALLQFSLDVGAATGVDMQVRQKALTFVQWVVGFKTKTFLNSCSQLFPRVIDVIFNLCAEPDADDALLDLTPHKFASQMLDAIACALPTRLVLSPCMEYITRFASDAAHAGHRRAALTALSVLAESCSDVLTQHLDKLLPFIEHGARDTDKGVRESSCLALMQFSEYLEPDILAYHRTVIPLLYATLDDPSDDVRIKCLGALETFCAELSENEIAPYLDGLMGKLLAIVHQSPSKEVRELAIVAIGSAATAAGKQFEKYFAPVCELAMSLMSTMDDRFLAMRAQATECIGRVGYAVGRAAFAPYVQHFMELAVQGMQTRDEPLFELREYTYSFFSNMAMLLEGDFQPFLPTVMAFCVASCLSDDGIMCRSTNENTPLPEGLESDPEEHPMLNLSIRTSFLDEKAAATRAIGLIARSVGAAFAPYLANTLELFMKLANYFHVDVRHAVAVALPNVMAAVLAAFPPETPWQMGTTQPLREEIRRCVGVAVPILLSYVIKDEDKQTVGAAFESISKIGQSVGPGAISPYLDKFIKAVAHVLEGQSNCQLHDPRRNDLSAGDDDQDVDEDDNNTAASVPDVDYDLKLLDSSTECMFTVAALFGPSFEPYFRTLYPLLMGYVNQSDSPGYRTMAIGAIAETIAAIKSAIGPYVYQLYPVVLQALSDRDDQTRRNAAYCVGLLAMHAPNEIANAGVHGGIQPALTALGQLLQNDKEAPDVKDNVLGALARIVLGNANVVPLQTILEAIFRYLPMRSDMEPYNPVCMMTLALFKSGRAEIQQLVPHVIRLGALALEKTEVEAQVRTEYVALLKALHQSFRPQVEGVMQQLVPAEQDVLRRLMLS